MLIYKSTILFFILFTIQVFSSPLDEAKQNNEIPSNDYQEIDFSTLTSHVNHQEIEDPFWNLEYDVLDKLVIIIDYQDAKTAGKSISKEQTQEHDKLKAELTEQNIDVEGLLEIRQKLIVNWKAENETTNPLIVNKNIQMKGFVLPIEWQGKKLSEFLLVPFVGACIHQPSPPPNQVVYVKLKTPINFLESDTFASVIVKGFLKSELQTPELNLVDGSEPVATSYELDAISLELNKDAMSMSMYSW